MGIIMHKITIKKDELDKTLKKIRKIIKDTLPSPWDQFLAHGPTGDKVEEGFLAYGFHWNKQEAGIDAPDITPFWDAIANIYK